ncbi:hypothetical protein EG327_008830 [Venturia inaequalis]|uniref:CENP-V/GFA domain-containing protein n=1 Tax=Venturia inaequalis TaxID=5025 RepID=A0A8H3UQ36_VENIN|nr:hypothetical protein EG327_008830 [Venturia inaequalis]
MADTTTTTDSPGRTYKGSCHCGFTKYTIKLRLPPAVLGDSTHSSKMNSSEMSASSPTPTVRLRKCNCTVCHKMGFFHVRVPFAPTDFSLLSPLDPFKELGDYQCYEKKFHWPFCKVCGVRCFGFFGDGEVVKREVDGVLKEVWAPKAEGWEEGKTGYLSVNASSLDEGQEGLDLREWHEKGWIHYLDCLDDKEEVSWERPHRGGCY